MTDDKALNLFSNLYLQISNSGNKEMELEYNRLVKSFNSSGGATLANANISGVGVAGEDKPIDDEGTIKDIDVFNETVESMYTSVLDFLQSEPSRLIEAIKDLPAEDIMGREILAKIENLLVNNTELTEQSVMEVLSDQELNYLDTILYPKPVDNTNVFLSKRDTFALSKGGTEVETVLLHKFNRSSLSQEFETTLLGLGSIEDLYYLWLNDFGGILDYSPEVNEIGTDDDGDLIRVTVANDSKVFLIGTTEDLALVVNKLDLPKIL